MDWTSTELRQLRQLRYRMGWSRAEMARALGCDFTQVTAWESGAAMPDAVYRSRLILFMTQADSNSERIQRRAVAEYVMENRGLDQLHNSEVIESLAGLNTYGSASKPVPLK